MNDEKIFELFQKISDQLRETTDSLRQIISNHETRIVVLEQKKNDDWKTTLLLLLAKAMLIGGVCLAAVTGASGIVAKIFGVG